MRDRRGRGPRPDPRRRTSRSTAHRADEEPGHQAHARRAGRDVRRPAPGRAERARDDGAGTGRRLARDPARQEPELCGLPRASRSWTSSEHVADRDSRRGHADVAAGRRLRAGHRRAAGRGTARAVGARRRSRACSRACPRRAARSRTCATCGRDWRRASRRRGPPRARIKPETVLAPPAGRAGARHARDLVEGLERGPRRRGWIPGLDGLRPARGRRRRGGGLHRHHHPRDGRHPDRDAGRGRGRGRHAARRRDAGAGASRSPGHRRHRRARHVHARSRHEGRWRRDVSCPAAPFSASPEHDARGANCSSW